ncbi:MAG: tetratricopeptide repeat protein [Nitrospiria bacterium]
MRREQGKTYRPGSFSMAFVFPCLLFTVYSLLFVPGCATQAKMQRLKEASAHYKLGISYLNDQQTQQAFVEFQKAVEQNPNDRDSQYALGHIYFLQQKYDEAEKRFKTTLKLDKDYSEAHNYLGKVYEQKGNIDAAIREYKMALKNPTYSTPDIARYNLGVAFQTKGERDEAIREFQQAVLINPDHLLAHYALAQLYAKSGKFEEAIATYKEVLRLFPESAEARYRLAWVYLKSNAKAQAVSEFGTLVERLPDSDLAKRSKKHLAFLQSKQEKLRPGMTSDQVMKVLGKSDPVVRRRGPVVGEEQWVLNIYDLVLRFQNGRYMGYQESLRE